MSLLLLYLQQGTQSLQFKFKARNIYLDKSATDIVFLWSNWDTYFLNEKKGGKNDTEMPKFYECKSESKIPLVTKLRTPFHLPFRCNYVIPIIRTLMAAQYIIYFRTISSKLIQLKLVFGPFGQKNMHSTLDF